jgi:plasmid stabilization system protein ParE
MDYQVVLSPSARADLRDIVRYISFDAPDRALEFALFLVSRTRLLARSPQLGRIVPEFAGPVHSRDRCAIVSSGLPPRRFAPCGLGHSLLARRAWHTGNRYASRLIESMSKHAELLALAKLRQRTRYPGYKCIGDYHSGAYECDFVSPYNGRTTGTKEESIMFRMTGLK